MDTRATRPDDLELVVVQVDDVRYALPVADVVELVRMVAVVPLPSAPAIVQGVIDVRGALVPVLDLRARFRLPARPVSPDETLVLAHARGRTVALRVDCALDLVRVPQALLEDVRSAVPSAQHVAGAAKLPDGLVLVHDLATFLSAEEESALDRALAARKEQA